MKPAHERNRSKAKGANLQERYTRTHTLSILYAHRAAAGPNAYGMRQGITHITHMTTVAVINSALGRFRFRSPVSLLQNQ
jgi:hypothetical protein